MADEADAAERLPVAEAAGRSDLFKSRFFFSISSENTLLFQWVQRDSAS